MSFCLGESKKKLKMENFLYNENGVFFHVGKYRKNRLDCPLLSYNKVVGFYAQKFFLIMSQYAEPLIVTEREIMSNNYF